jgi:ribonuclease G
MSSNSFSRGSRRVTFKPTGGLKKVPPATASGGTGSPSPVVPGPAPITPSPTALPYYPVIASAPSGDGSAPAPRDDFRSERPERSPRPQRPERTDRPERAEGDAPRPERAESGERGERSEGGRRRRGGRGGRGGGDRPSREGGRRGERPPEAQDPASGDESRPPMLTPAESSRDAADNAPSPDGSGDEDAQRTPTEGAPAENGGEGGESGGDGRRRRRRGGRGRSRGGRGEGEPNAPRGERPERGERPPRPERPERPGRPGRQEPRSEDQRPASLLGPDGELAEDNNVEELADEAAVEAAIAEAEQAAPVEDEASTDTEFVPVPVADPKPQGLVENIRAVANKIVKKVQQIIAPPEKRTHKEVVINSESLETRVAVSENGRLEEFTIERTTEERLVGSIFKGKVRNLEEGLKAAFVDIGFEKNAFLHYWDIVPNNFDSGIEVVERESKDGKKKEKVKFTQKDVPRLFPPGSDIIVQVTKGPIGTKGPRITTNISLPGRYMVLMPRNDQLGISRKIEDPKERTRLRKIMSDKLTIPEKMGVILRTVSAGQKVRYFVRDLAILVDQWREIEEKASTNKAPTCVFKEPDLIERTVRDFLTDEIDEVLCDDQAAAERMKDLIGVISRRSRKRIQYYQTTTPIFEKLGIQRQIDDAFYRQVWLPSGGYLVIDETEALIAIDVNTGRAKNQDKMILQTNIEAAEEVARQVRLRNIGGLLVIDFIDMKSRRDQMAVYKAMKERLKHDKAKTQILQISPLGLMEMTRQRLHESLNITVNEPCHHCQGRGMVKSAESMSVELQRRLNSILGKSEAPGRELLVIVNPDVMERLRTHDGELFVELERRHNARLTFRSDASYHREQVVVADAKTQKEIRE